MTRMNGYFKGAVVATVFIPLLIVAEYVLVLSPIYSLAGKTGADITGRLLEARLNRAIFFEHALKIVIVLDLLVIGVCVAMGIWKQQKQTQPGSRVEEK